MTNGVTLRISVSCTPRIALPLFNKIGASVGFCRFPKIASCRFNAFEEYRIDSNKIEVLTPHYSDSARITLLLGDRHAEFMRR
jgi:hypothetical protein